MSRPDLYDLYIRSGASDLLDRATAADIGIGIDRVERVLIHLLLNGDVNGQIFMGTPRIADQIRLPRQRIEEAFTVLEASGLAERTGARRSRAIVWQMLPKQLAAEQAKDDMHGDLHGEVHGEVHGDLHGEVHGIPGTKGREGKRREGRKPRTDTQAPLVQPQPDPYACPKHPQGWHHDDPCGKCAEWKRADAERRRTPAPAREELAVLDDMCDHENPRGRCPECRRNQTRMEQLAGGIANTKRMTA